MSNSDERDYQNERAVALEYEREQWEELGHEHAMLGRSRNTSRKWLKRHATINQERAFWKGYSRVDSEGI